MGVFAFAAAQTREINMPIETTFNAGYVLIRSGTQDVHSVKEKLLEMRGVWIAHPLIGPDDLICYFEAYDPQEFQNELDNGIRRLVDEGLIEHTETLMVLTKLGRGYDKGINRPAPAAAWLFCDISVGNPEPVAARLLSIKGVVNAHPVIGRYDMIAYLEAPSMHELMRLLDRELRHVEGIKTTDTRLVLMQLDLEMPFRDRNHQKPVGTERSSTSAPKNSN